MLCSDSTPRARLLIISDTLLEEKMPRCNGYRPTKAVRKEVQELRAQLATLTTDRWVKASYIMQNITALLGHSGGPSGGSIQPRACRYCHYFGHTKQWCPARERNEKLRAAQLIREDEVHFEKVQAIAKVPRKPYEPSKSSQALHLDEIGVPWKIHPDCGVTLAAPGDVCAGKWQFSSLHTVVPSCTSD